MVLNVYQHELIILDLSNNDKNILSVKCFVTLEELLKIYILHND